MCEDLDLYLKLILPLGLLAIVGIAAFDLFRLRLIIREKENLVRHLGEDLATWRRRAITAESMIHDQDIGGAP